MMKICLLFSITAPILMSGCNAESSVVGAYKVNRSPGRDTLFIEQNHKFRQHYVDSNGNSYTNEGEWRFSSAALEFDGFIWYLPGYGPNDRRKVFWIGNYR